MATRAALAIPIAALIAAACAGETDATVVALDAGSGEELWRNRTDGWAIDPPAVTEGLVLVQGHHSIYAFDALSGDEEWRVGTASTSVRSGPIVSEGIILLTAIDDDSNTSTHPLVAIDASTGKRSWSGGCIPEGYQGASAGPDGAYLESICEWRGAPQTYIVAFDLQTGAEAWSTSDLQVGNVWWAPPMDPCMSTAAWSTRTTTAAFERLMLQPGTCSGSRSSPELGAAPCPPVAVWCSCDPA